MGPLEDGGCGFNPVTASYLRQTLGNIPIIIIALAWYWKMVAPFILKAFLYGFFGAFLDCIALAFVTDAFSKGPMGPVTALVGLNNVCFAVIEAVRSATLPHWM